LLFDFDVSDIYSAVAKVKDDWNERLSQLPLGFSGRPRLVLLLPDGQTIRTFLRTKACRRLAKWSDLFVLSPFDIADDVRRIGPNTNFFQIPLIHRIRFDTMLGYLGYLQTRSPTSRRFAQRLEENLQKALTTGARLDNSLRVWQIAAALQSNNRYLDTYCWSMRLFAGIFSLTEIVGMLRRLQPDLVVNSSAVNWSSRLWTRAAALAGIPIVSNVISWDNMSTKTLLDEFVDTFLIWSDEMEEDFTTSVPYVRDKPRVIVGTPQFEPIIQQRGLMSRADFFRQYGLDPDKKLILYTTGSKTLFPREAECLDAVLGHWREHLTDRANIMVRMHPKDRRGRYEAVMAKFPEVPFTLAGTNLAQGDDWVPSENDIALLVNQLNHCDVVVNVASTMTLEGFAIDKPSINIGFSLGGSISARYPMDDYYKSRHYCDIVDSGAARLVNDYAELFAAIDDILDRSAFDVEKQRRVLRMKCSYSKGSSNRIDAFLKSHAAKRIKPLPVRLFRWYMSPDHMAGSPATRRLRWISSWFRTA
jgi:hypothetical protein